MLKSQRFLAGGSLNRQNSNNLAIVLVNYYKELFREITGADQKRINKLLMQTIQQ